MRVLRPLVLFGVLLTVTSAWASRPYRGGAVATQNAEASLAALKMLERGGNAVDAAVAAAFVLGVVDPFHSGIGGGGFALLWDAKQQKARALDFREVAPQGATRDMYLDAQGQVVPGRSTDLGASIAVPGAVKGYLELHQTHGRLPRKVVLAPAIELARKGRWVTPKYAARAEKRLACLSATADAARIFLRPGEGGAPAVPEVGTVLPQPELARTLQELAARGERAFYSGRIAQAIAASAQQAGGVLTVADLAAYKTLWRDPLEGSYRGHRVLTMPPPSAGGVAVLQVLRALERRYPERLPYRDAQALHVYVEVLRRVYADRNRYLGDPGFVQIDLAALLSPDYVTPILAAIGPKATPSLQVLPAPAAGAEVPGAFQEKKQTSHLSVVDREGNAVALTTTINYYFGSCVVAKGTGILLNDQMDDFTAKPGVPNVYGLVMGEANAIAPGKRPASSMSPTLVFQKDAPGRVMLVTGSPGGSTIPTTVIQTVSNVVDHGMDVARAVAWGRLHHQYLPDAIWVDAEALEPATAEALRAMGHRLEPTDPWGDAEAVFVDPKTGLRYAASDPRGEGAPAGQD